MTAFTNKTMRSDGEYLFYTGDTDPKWALCPRFIARFRNGGKVAFKKFLRENFTVDEYFKLYDDGMPPIKILETKGYVSPNVCMVLKRHGYPLTVEGKNAYLKGCKDGMIIAPEVVS